MNKSTTLAHGTVTVTSSATQIRDVEKRETIIVQNTHGTDALYVGSSSVSTANGLRVAAGGSLTLEEYCGALYGVRGAANDLDVRYLVTG